MSKLMTHPGEAVRLPSGPPLHVEMLGPLHLAFEGREIPLRSRKSRALFAYLATLPHRTDSRVRLAGLLWSEKTDRDSRVSLRQQLAGLRRDLAGLDLLRSDWLEVALAPNRLHLDIDTVRLALDEGSVPDMLLNRKDLADAFLTDLDGLDPAFDYWLVIQRGSLRDQLLRKLTAILTEGSAPALRRDAALAILNLDPTSEEACRVLMHQHAARGDIAAALRVYGDLWSLLDRDFDMEPAEETQALAARVKLGEISSATSSTAVAPAVESGTILILAEPFENEGIDEAYMRRVAGLRHELIAALTRFRDWSVREAAAPLSGPVAAGRKTYVMTATAAQEEDEIYVSLTLRRQSDSVYLWSQRVSIKTDQWIAKKLGIIRRIAASLEVQISAERLSRTANLPDSNLDVYDRWIRGNGLIYRWQPSDEVRAEAIFRSIIADAQDFAPAYASLVQILNTRHHVFPGVMRDRAREAEALDLAKIAVRLDPRDTRTQLCLAWSHVLNDHFEQGAMYYDLALQLNESDPWTLTSCAQGLSYCDEKLKARQLADKALEVAIGGAPIHWSYQTCIRFLDEDYAGAVSAAEHAEGSAFFVPAIKAAALAHLREYDAAERAVRKFYADVAANWYGEAPVDAQAVLDWFCQCFPTRLETDRSRLSAGIVAAGLLRLGHGHGV